VKKIAAVGFRPGSAPGDEGVCLGKMTDYFDGDEALARLILAYL